MFIEERSGGEWPERESKAQLESRAPCSEEGVFLAGVVVGFFAGFIAAAYSIAYILAGLVSMYFEGVIH